MTEELKALVKNRVLQFLDGHTLETNKFELKLKWYDLRWRVKQQKGEKSTYNRDYFEFLKDVTSIINSGGGDSGFIVIGVNQDTKELSDTNIKDCGLDDSSKVKEIIVNNIDTPFVIDIDYLEIHDKQLSVIHIPSTLFKPHIILDYVSPANQKFENEIFVRNGSGSHVARKSDLDRMYWERGNIVLPEKLHLALNRKTSGFEPRSLSDQNDKCVIIYRMNCVFSNEGTRPLTIYEIEMKLIPQNIITIGETMFQEFVFTSNIVASMPKNEDSVIVKPNESISLKVDFFSNSIPLPFEIVSQLCIDFNTKTDISNVAVTNGKNQQIIPEVSIL